MNSKLAQTRRAKLIAELETKHKFDMDRWLRPFGANYEERVEAANCAAQGKPPTGEAIEHCGTTACMAGEAALLWPRQFAKAFARLKKEGRIIAHEFDWHIDKHTGLHPLSTIAAEVLDVDSKAFFLISWPYALRELYQEGKRVEAAQKALDYFANP